MLDKLGLYFFGLFFPLLAAVAGRLMWMAWKRGTASMHWPTVPGQIQQSVVQYHSGDGGRYSPWIQYGFTVAGQRYQCDMITYRSLPTDRAAAESYVERYPPGSPVHVFYDPESPDVAVLEPGADRRSYLIGAAVLFILFAVGVGFGIAALL
jgi:hypothetical protein